MRENRNDERNRYEIRERRDLGKMGIFVVDPDCQGGESLEA